MRARNGSGLPFHRDGPCVYLGLRFLGSYLATLAGQFSQRLAHSSTRWNAGGLICRVRDGYGSCPAAMAALMPIDGIEPSYASIGDRSDICRMCTCDSVYAWIRLPGVVTDSCGMTVWLRPVSARGLNASLPRRAHPESIELVFYEWPQRYLFSRWVSSLDAFSSYPVSRGCPARALSNNRYTSGDQS